MRFLLVFCFIITCFVEAFPQTELTIASQKNGHHLQLKIGDRVRIHFSANKLKKVGGKIVSFSDSIIAIKTRQGAENIEVSSITFIKKTNGVRLLCSFSAPVILTIVSLTTYSIFPPLIAASIIPTTKAYDLITGNNIKAPIEINILRKK